jgi:hypothetical protein
MSRVDFSDIIAPPNDGWRITHRCGGELRPIEPDYHGWARTFTCIWCGASIEIHVTNSGYRPRKLEDVPA